MIKSKTFIESVATPMYSIIKDISTECFTTFLGVEKIETEDNILESIYSKNGDKIECPICSYLISDIKINSNLYTDSGKTIGTEILDSNRKPALNNLNKGLKLRQVPVIVTADLFATFDNYDDAWSFLLDTLWIDREKEVEVVYNMKGFLTTNKVYYKLDDDFNNPEPTTKSYMKGLYTARLSVEFQTILFKCNATKPAITDIRVSDVI